MDNKQYIKMLIEVGCLDIPAPARVAMMALLSEVMNKKTVDPSERLVVPTMTFEEAFGDGEL